jgi:hypothetical protein
MRLVVVESPLAAPSAKEKCERKYERQALFACICDRCVRVRGELELNRQYLADAMLDCFKRGEAPYASHRLYPGILDDTILDQRKLGMEAGFAWGAKADLVAVYTDLGISGGMEAGMMRAKMAGQPIGMRSLEGWRAKR